VVTKRVGNRIKHRQVFNQRAAAGFSLIEVMVALIIVSVALPALLVQVMGMMDATAAIRDKTIALWVAENKYQELQLGRRLYGQLLSGASQGNTLMADRHWRWRVTSNTTGVQGLRRFIIEVGEGVAEQAPIIRLEKYLDEPH